MERGEAGYGACEERVGRDDAEVCGLCGWKKALSPPEVGKPRRSKLRAGAWGSGPDLGLVWFDVQAGMPQRLCRCELEGCGRPGADRVTGIRSKEGARTPSKSPAVVTQVPACRMVVPCEAGAALEVGPQPT